MHARRPGVFAARIAKLATLVLVAVLLATTLGPATAGAAPPTGERVGVHAGSMVLWESEMERVAELDAIAATGARWFSLDIDWASIEWQRGKFRWAATDRVVLHAKARGLKILGVIAYSPKWARGPDCPEGNTHCLPTRAEDYANFAQIVAQRYGNFAANPAFRGAVPVWQVWNEPNHYPFVQYVNILHYTNMLKQTYAAIKAVDGVSWVIAGGTSPAPDDPSGKDMSPATFLSAIYYLGGRGSFDAFGHHPYSFPCSPYTEADWNAFHQTLTLRWIMVYNGDWWRPIWGTEVGAPTGADVGSCFPFTGAVSVTEPVQALFAAQYIARWTQDWASFTGPLFWFMIRDKGVDPMNFDHHFGLLRRDFTEKLSYQTFKYLMGAP